MPVANGLMSELGLLAAYGEYSEENSVLVKRKKTIIPVNHLGEELSPYLLQHARNPIGWYSWGNDAFEAARQEDKPVFLSIGYSSCHWCHVMERECFNDPEVAELMNDTCIPVKVDREERPDLDALFMEVCNAQNGSGGWPLNIFMTPEGFPFFCTTWLPKRTTGQMPGITDILPRVKWLWLMQHHDITRASQKLTALMKERSEIISGSKSGARIGRFAAREAFDILRHNFDIRWGGFGSAPKFPDAPRLLFLLKYSDENSDFRASQKDRYDSFTMIDITLRRMWRGGIHDHLGGGFARYAIDERWLVPHFEKLLCDQAMLLLVVALAQEMKQNSFYRLMAEDIIFCAARDFSDSSAFSQGFRSAVDADTSEGEGRYYLWTEDEIKAILPEDYAGLFCAAYAVLPSGNFGNELAGSQMGYNILYEASNVTELARRYNIKGNEVGHILSECRKLLLEARDRRPAPLYDDKILMDWNGLMIGALARASAAFGQPEWRAMAERTALFLQKNLLDSKGVWHRRWRGGKAGIDALSGDYAALLWGVMELYKASKKAEAGEKQLSDWLKYAQSLADSMLEKFWDEKLGGLFLMPGDDPNIFLRFKSAGDGALPSANALAAMALSELGTALDEKKYSDLAKKIIDCFSRAAVEQPVSYLSLIVANSLWKPVKPKPKPAPKPVPTDEELNREEPSVTEKAQTEAQEDDRRASRASRRSRIERSERRTARPHRSSRTR